MARDPGAEVRELLRRQRDQLDGLTEEAQRKIAALLEDTQRDLERELRRYQDSAPESFTAHDYRLAMERVRAIAQGLEDRLAVQEAGRGAQGLLVDFGERARGLGLDHLEEQIARFSEVFEGYARTVDLRVVARTLDEVLLERFEGSVRNYGYDGVSAIQRELAQAQLAGRFPRQHADRVMQVTGFGEDERWKADRIVRTELANAYSGAHLEGLRAANEQDPGYRKKLVATFDDRTGSDSRFVDGQARELDEPFEDNEGRVYQHPPNRPNDREVEVADREEWTGEAAAPVGEAAAGEAGGEQAAADVPPTEQVEPSAAEASEGAAVMEPPQEPPQEEEPQEPPVVAPALEKPIPRERVDAYRSSLDDLNAISTQPPGRDQNRIPRLTEDFTADERAVLDSVTLFTNGNVATVRDPSLYRPALKSKGGIRGPVVLRSDGGWGAYGVDDTADAYRKAHEVLYSLASKPGGYQGVVTRGMALSPEEISELKPGALFDLRGMSSFTTSDATADSFAQSEAVRQHGKRAVVFRVPDGLRHGADVTKISHFPDEREVVSYGRLKVVRVSDPGPPAPIEVVVEHVGSTEGA